MPQHDDKISEIVNKAASFAHEAARAAAEKGAPKDYEKEYKKIFGHIFTLVTGYMKSAYGIDFDNNNGNP